MQLISKRSVTINYARVFVPKDKLVRWLRSLFSKEEVILSPLAQRVSWKIHYGVGNWICAGVATRDWSHHKNREGMRSLLDPLRAYAFHELVTVVLAQ